MSYKLLGIPDHLLKPTKLLKWDPAITCFMLFVNFELVNAFQKNYIVKICKEYNETTYSLTGVFIHHKLTSMDKVFLQHKLLSSIKVQAWIKLLE